MGKREYFWYLEPLDSHTNQVFSRELPHKDASREVTNKTKKAPNLWECPSEKVAMFWNSREDQHLEFRIYNRCIFKSCLGPLQECTFLFSRKWKKRLTPALSSQATH